MQVVQRAWDPLAALLEYVRINHGRPHVVVAQELLDGADIGPALQQVRRKAMTESMRAHYFDHSRFSGGNLDRFVHHRRIHMMAPNHTRQRIGGHIPRREHVLPPPFLRRVWIFSFQRVGQLNRAVPRSQVPLVESFCPAQVVLQQRHYRGGQRRKTVLVTFS